ICPRETTVLNLYHRVLVDRVLLVRGTPAIGKTTLLKLLYYFIEGLADGPSVFQINGWARDRVMASSSGWADYIFKQTKGLDVWDRSLDYFLLVDEAQSTYWDDQFWSGFIKEVAQGSWAGGKHYVVLFSSYGSVSLPDAITPPYLGPEKTVSLRSDPNDPHPVALLLNPEEFIDALERKAKDPRLNLPLKYTEQVATALYHATQGHAGALHSLIASFTSSPVPTINKAFASGHVIDLPLLDQYFADFNTSFESLAKTLWRRGLPASDELQNDIAATQILSTLVRDRRLYPNEYSEAQRLAVERCHRKGWIHSAWVGDQRIGRLAYVLPSLLHEWYLSLLLFAPAQELPVQLGICTPLDLLKQAVRKFQPSQLQAPVTIGPSCEPRPNEAIFQDEFYRACHTVTKGKLLATPEFGSTSGRIDFYMQGVRWGFEFLRNGNRLRDHLKRFSYDDRAEHGNSSGAYGAWVASGVMLDYLVVDFRNAMPPRPLQPQVRQLYHVVFSVSYETACIVDSELRVVMDSVRLLE
ncbi:hypothetical protein EV426DRAFT_685726, partial [Tirmania nivea]